MMDASFAFSVLDDLSDAIIWVYPVMNGSDVVDFEVRYANRTGNEITGHPQGGLQGLHILRDGVPSRPGAPANFAHFLAVYQSQEEREYRFFAHHSGREMETVRRPYHGGVLSTTRDRKAQREAEQKALTARQTLESIAENSPNGIIVYDAIRNESGAIDDFRIRHHNERINELVGFTTSDRRSMTMRDVLAKINATELFDSYVKVVEDGRPFHLEQFVEKTQKWVSNTTVKLEDGVLLTLTDITDIKLKTQELQQMVKALERSNAYLEDFAYAASHDMKEPLRKIRTFVDRLRIGIGDRLTGDEIRLFERVEASANRMQLMVDDLLEFSYVSEKPREMVDVDLAEKMKKILAEFDLRIEETSARVAVGNLPVVKGHKRQLEQLFYNLVGNALKYRKPTVRPEISVQARSVKGSETPVALLLTNVNQQFFQIDVSDNGIGFEQEFAEQIFQMFQRLHGKEEYAGTGVGLSIARKVVENHHGHIWATGESGKGATFHVLLPKDQ